MCDAVCISVLLPIWIFIILCTLSPISAQIHVFMWKQAAILVYKCSLETSQSILTKNFGCGWLFLKIKPSIVILLNWPSPLLKGPTLCLQWNCMWWLTKNHYSMVWILSEPLKSLYLFNILDNSDLISYQSFNSIYHA